MTYSRSYRCCTVEQVKQQPDSLHCVCSPGLAYGKRDPGSLSLEKADRLVLELTPMAPVQRSVDQKGLPGA